MQQFRLPRWLTARLVMLQLALLGIPFLLLASPEPAFAQTACTGTRDYGDAPSGYGVACATPSATLRIGGVTPDTETVSQFSAGANGDDILGTDDESFLNPLTPIDLANPQYIWTIPVSNTTGSAATLAGWIDFNSNGTFDTNERVTASVPNNATSATLTWNIPITATPTITNTYVRLRLSTNANVEPTGDYPANGIGEVEDYAVQIIESDVCAPGTSFYTIDGTTATNTIIRLYDVTTGASTLVVDPPQGRTNGIAVDRYRGMIYYQDARPSSSPTPVANDILGYDVVNGTSFTVTTAIDSAPLNIPLPTNGWRAAAGAFANGRYYAGLDGENTPDTSPLHMSGAIYEITLSTDGLAPISARVLVTPTGTSGGDQITNRVNYGDILVIGNRLYAAYGVDPGGTINTYRHIFDVYDINSQTRLTRQDLGANTDANPIQLGRDGNGQVWLVRNTPTVTSTSVYTVTNDVVIGFPASPRNTIGYSVSDASECPIVPMDFGDAPNSYGTNVGPRAARHLLNANLRLGSVTGESVIRDLRGFASVNANGDDQNNYNGSIQGGIDDEDAITGSLPSIDASNPSHTISNITVFNNTGTPATLFGWIDFNRDGEFQPTERATVAVPSSASPQTVALTWSSLPGVRNGVSYVRLRLSTATTTISNWGAGNDGAFLATGYAPNGEVEDYPILISGATAVQLTSFRINTPIDWTIPGSIAGLLVAVVGIVIAGLGTWRSRFK